MIWVCVLVGGECLKTRKKSCGPTRASHRFWEELHPYSFQAWEEQAVVWWCLSASNPLWLEVIIYFQNTKQTFRKQERCHSPWPWPRAGICLWLPPQLLPSTNLAETGNCRGHFCFPSRDTGLRFFSCSVAAAAVLPCRHLVAMTREVVNVPECESINLTGTGLSTYIPC